MKADHPEQRVDDPQTAFERFKDFTRRIIAVPKSEVDKRIQTLHRRKKEPRPKSEIESRTKKKRSNREDSS